ncbi:TPA: LysE family translocator [Vibrio parahaemolyticus]|nr:LysE family translocator [Vibrio parahaemolyticus]
MDINNLIAFMAVTTLLVISPGPNGFLIAKTVPLSGKQAGMANIGGFIVAFYVHGTLSIFGISVLLVQSANAFIVFKMLGAVYLIFIGFKSLFGAFKVSDSHLSIPASRVNKPVSIRTAFITGFLTNVLNPKVSMFYLAAFPQFISLKENVINAYALVTVHSLINFIWFTAMVLMLSRIKSATSNVGFKRWLSALTGLVFIGFGSKLALMKNG